MRRLAALAALAALAVTLVTTAVLLFPGDNFDEPGVGSGGAPPNTEPPEDGAPPNTEPPEDGAPPNTEPPSDPVSRILQRISEQGRILYNPPSEMRLGQTETVEVRIARDEVTDLTQGLTGSGEPVQEQLPVANAMIVELLGPDFDIVPLSPKRQLVGGQPFNEWAWRIQAQQAGTTFLRLTVSIEIPKTKKLEGLSPVVLSRQIEVDVNFIYALGQFVGGNWQVLLPSAVALVAASGILAVRRKRESTEAPDR